MLTTGVALLGFMCRRAACQSAGALIHHHQAAASCHTPSVLASYCFNSLPRISSATLHSSTNSWHNSGSEASKGETIMVVFIDKDNVEHALEAPIGKSLMEVAHDNDIELEGACEGSLACSTCHVIVEDEEVYKTMPEPCDDELDMLDLAFALTATSRLGCQIIASKELDGLRVRVPSASRNFYVDGHKPKPH